MIRQLTLIVAFIATGFLTIMVWGAVLEKLPQALQEASFYDCTFACNSHATSVVWPGLVVAMLLTFVVVGVLYLMVSQKPSRMG